MVAIYKNSTSDLTVLESNVVRSPRCVALRNKNCSSWRSFNFLFFFLKKKSFRFSVFWPAVGFQVSYFSKHDQLLKRYHYKWTSWWTHHGMGTICTSYLGLQTMYRHSFILNFIWRQYFISVLWLCYGEEGFPGQGRRGRTRVGNSVQGNGAEGNGIEIFVVVFFTLRRMEIQIRQVGRCGTHSAIFWHF